MNLKILVINILLFVLSEVFAYQTRKCDSHDHGLCPILASAYDADVFIQFGFFCCLFFFVFVQVWSTNYVRQVIFRSILTLWCRT